MAEIRPVQYSKEVQKLVFPDNSFHVHSVRESGIADTVTAVEKPVQGKIREAKTGEPESLPLKIYRPLDSKISYETQLVYAEPLLVESPSEFALNYNKRALKQQQQADEINTKVANIAATNWGPTKSDNIILTTGTARASHITGIAGNRKALTKDDMLALHNLILRMSAAGQWFMLANADIHTDLLKIPEFVDYYKTGNETALRNGIVGKILNLNILLRSTDAGHIGLMYNSSKEKKAEGAKIAASDLPASLIWNDKFVCSAEGRMRTAVNTSPAGFLGSTIIEAWTRFGADIIREDERGVIALLEA